MAGDEHQPQQVVAHVLVGVQDGVEFARGTLLARFHVPAEQAQFLAKPLVPADPVNGAMLGGNHEPGAGVRGDSVSRPLLKSRDQGVLGQFLGQAHVPDQPGQARDDPGGLHPPQGFDHVVGSPGV